MPNKEIKASLKSKTQLRIDEQANIGDYIDITKIGETLDQSIINDVFLTIKDKGMDEVIERRVKEKIDLIQEKFDATLNQEKIKVQASYTKDINDKEQDIQKLKSQLEMLNHKITLAKKEGSEEVKIDLESKINKLNNQIENFEIKKRLEIERSERALENQYKSLLNQKDTLISAKEDSIRSLETQKANWKNIGTKILGEDFEKECSNFFENNILVFLPKDVYFEKDTKLVKEDGENKASKGDFLYREKFDKSTPNGQDFSIMFEMKNQKLEQEKGVPNSKYLSQANKNRIKKECKYAVIVSTLEPDDSFAIKEARGYENVWIVRPDFLKEIFELLRNKELEIYDKTKTMSNELLTLRQDNSENQQFEASLISSKKDIFKSYKNLIDHFDKDSKDLASIIKTAVLMWHRRNKEKKKIKSVVSRTFALSSKTAESLELKELRKQLNELNKKGLDKQLLLDTIKSTETDINNDIDEENES